MSALAESTLRIDGMHCAACADAVERALASVPGVVQARVNAAARCASVRRDPARATTAELVGAVARAGYEAAPDTAAAARAARTREARAALWRLFVAAFCTVQVMMLAEPAYFAAPGDIAPEHARLLAWGAWLLTLPVLCFSAAPFFAGAWRSLRHGRIGMDVPVALGIAVAFVASSGAAFDPGGPFGREVWFDSTTMFIAFLLGGRWLEMRLRHRAEAALEDTATRLPQAVLRLEPDGSTRAVEPGALVPGDRVRVPLGEAFAADGTIESGATAADESALTGESVPVPKRAGDAVLAGSLNVGAPVVLVARRTGADTRCEAIAALMRAARAQRPALLAFADRGAAAFLWTVLGLAALAGLAWHAIDPARTVGVVVAVLVVTCPCALSLAAPAALLAAAGAMGRRGLLVRHVDAIAALAAVDTLFVDKTGTLTTGVPHCAGLAVIDPSPPLPAAALAATASSLAACSGHPLSKALQARFAPGDVAWHALLEAPGRGIEGVDADGHRWRLGAQAWVGGVEPAADDGPHALLSRDGRVLARIDFDEAVRDDVPAAVAALRAGGVRVELLSGDAPARAAAMGARLALDAARGGLSPEAKLAAVRAAQAAGTRVAMLGDGVNDAPVLAQADVSIAMGDGAQVARTQADAVLVSGRLADLAAARTLARRALRVVHQNLAWAAGYNLLCVPLALAGALPPWAAGLGMATSSLVVVANSMRLAR